MALHVACRLERVGRVRPRVVETVHRDQIGRHVAEVDCERATVVPRLMTGACLLGAVQRSGGVAGGKLDLGEIAGDRCRRTFEIERNVVGERFGVKQTRALDIAATRTQTYPGRRARGPAAGDCRARCGILERAIRAASRLRRPSERAQRAAGRMLARADLQRVETNAAVECELRRRQRRSVLAERATERGLGQVELCRGSSAWVFD